MMPSTKQTIRLTIAALLLAIHAGAFGLGFAIGRAYGIRESQIQRAKFLP